MNVVTGEALTVRLVGYLQYVSVEGELLPDAESCVLLPNCDCIALHLEEQESK